MSTAKERAEIYGTPKWKRARRQALRRAGWLCEICSSKGRTVPGRLVHHKTFLKEGGAIYESENLQCVCRKCHEAIHEVKHDEWSEYIRGWGRQGFEK